MTDILLFVIALIPGLAWLGVACLIADPDSQFRRRLLRLFFLGMVVCIPAGYFNPLLQGSLIGKKGLEAFSDPVFFFFVVGPVEETLKYFIIRSERPRKARVRTIREGVLLSTASALGFATYENMHYMRMLGIQVILTRAWLTCILHAVCSAFFGYTAGYARTRGYSENWLALEGIAIAAACHGFYNTLASRESPWMYVVVALLMLVYANLVKGERRPLMVRIFKSWLERPVTRWDDDPPIVPRFGRLQGKSGETQVADVLAGLEEVDEELRLEALRWAATLRDDRVYRAVRLLTHDPSPAVRDLAGDVYGKLRAELASRDEQ